MRKLLIKYYKGVNKYNFKNHLKIDAFGQKYKSLFKLMSVVKTLNGMVGGR